MKILTVVGARPQFVKASVVSRAIAAHNRTGAAVKIEEDIIHTGQHYDPAMSDVFFKQMEIPQPAANLNVGSGPQGAVTAEMLKGLEKEIIDRKPEIVLVYGDTNSTLAGGLASAKLHVPVAHVEAGLRSFNMRMPEEVNRVLTDRISSILFCPSARSVRWLAEENITKNVFNVGDVMFDAFLHYLSKSEWPAEVSKRDSPYALSTLHRAENTDDSSRLTSIFSAFAEMEIDILLPVHPRTKKVIYSSAIKIPQNVYLISPVPYFSMLGLLKKCQFVLTDSGGLQKEAYFAKKKTLTLRDETEWVELVDVGMNRVVGTDKARILRELSWVRSTPGEFNCEIYGSGNAGEIIVKHLAERAWTF